LVVEWQIAAHLNQILKEFSAAPDQAPKSSIPLRAGKFNIGAAIVSAKKAGGKI
jgi:hypothetical protein